MSMLFFHCVCTWSVTLIRLPWSIVNLFNLDVFRQIIRLPWSIWRTEFSVKTFSSISWERDVPFNNKTHLACLSGCLDRSQIGLVIGWVSWENVACWTSPRDCRTTLPSGCWSPVEPNGTFPLVQSWRKEIFGGSRGYIYAFLISDFSSLQSDNFWNTISWKYSLKDDCIRSSLIEC